MVDFIDFSLLLSKLKNEIEIQKKQIINKRITFNDVINNSNLNDKNDLLLRHTVLHAQFSRNEEDDLVKQLHKECVEQMCHFNIKHNFIDKLDS